MIQINWIPRSIQILSTLPSLANNHTLTVIFTFSPYAMKYFLKTLVSVSLLVSPISSVFSQSLQPQDIIDRLYTNQMTIYTSIDEYRPEDLLTRGEAAKMITKFAQSLSLTQDYPWTCEFDDITEYDSTLVPYITTSCSFGLIKWWNGLFNPTGTLTQAQALVIIQRARSGFQNETWTPRYREYFQDAIGLGIVSSDQIVSVENTPITRFELWAWLYRASWNWTNIIDTTVYIPQWAVSAPPVVIRGQTQPSGNSTTTATSPVYRNTRDETKLTWLYTRNFNYDTYQPFSDATLQLELAAWKRVVLFFGSQSSLQSRALDASIKKWVWGNVSILFVDFDRVSWIKSTYWVNTPHTLIYLNTSWDLLFRTESTDMSVSEIIGNFDRGGTKTGSKKI